MSKYMTRKEVAQEFKVSIQAVDIWCKKGYLKPYGIGRRILFKTEEINQALTALH